MIQPILFLILLVVLFAIGLVRFGLADFSRSRLDRICQARGNPNRFGAILKRHERALIVIEFLYLLTFSVAVIWSRFLLDLRWPESRPNIQTFWEVGKWLLVAIGFAFGCVALPWTIARVSGEKVLYRVWPLLRGMILLARPFLTIFDRVDGALHRLTGREERDNGESTLAEEILSVVDEGQREGVLESEARSMIHRVMELAEVDTGAVMTPRTDMFCIPVTHTLEEARQTMLESGHSRVPVVGESTDDICGILYAKDLLKYIHDSETSIPLSEIVRPPFYVPESSGIDTLLESLKRERVHLAVVIDEYGGVAGLVTMEDILEEIVGDISDEYDEAKETLIREIDDNNIEVDARVHIDDLNDRFRFELPEDKDFDTVGGFAFSQFARVPNAGESFTWQQLRFTVIDADERRLGKLKIEVDPSLAAAANEE